LDTIEETHLPFPQHKTKIVATIGPASESTLILESMMRSGMNIARLNFSHGNRAAHAETIRKIRTTAQITGQRVAIMADLPGPKMRIGELAKEAIDIENGHRFTLTVEDIVGDQKRVAVSFKKLPQAVKKGDRLFLNDGYIELQVIDIADTDVHCEVLIGGSLRSRKGLNLPGIDLGISAFTDNDLRWLEFAREQDIDAVSQSFVESAGDVLAVRRAAAEMGYQPFIIAKIERARARDRIDEILDAADGIMIARGDLGVEIPIEQIANAQKYIMRKANTRGKPVITATQLLESMISNRRPTRAEATDVANAILDGTDSVMLSGESAMGDYPVESVAMLAKIAAATEPHRSTHHVMEAISRRRSDKGANPQDLIALSVAAAVSRITPPTIVVPTRGGATARRISRFRLPVWISAVSSEPKTCQDLLFSYGVYPHCETEHPDTWKSWVCQWMERLKLEGDLVLVTEGPSRKHPGRNNRMEIIDLRDLSARCAS
jgi:pyruvate kinase